MGRLLELEGGVCSPSIRAMELDAHLLRLGSSRSSSETFSSDCAADVTRGATREQQVHGGRFKPSVTDSERVFARDGGSVASLPPDRWSGAACGSVEPLGRAPVEIEGERTVAQGSRGRTEASAEGLGHLAVPRFVDDTSVMYEGRSTIGTRCVTYLVKSSSPSMWRGTGEYLDGVTCGGGYAGLGSIAPM
ncbi:hypothetical protein EYF80_051618 [Liparis tanakae]|uniref:Uncharacterized protein n=1 Tax=Liparis tanakae TaxID=230148 RepID=A0A4Z2FAK1_9TELE|nr:hypothetical protein EYF80_051618 [Liparis tanakae]